MIWLRGQISMLLGLLTLGFLSYTLVDRYIFSPNQQSTQAAPFIPKHDESQIPDSVVNATRILLVSAFFPTATTSNTREHHNQWLSTFLSQVKTDIYFFTCPELEATIKELRADLPITINTSFSSAFDIPPLKGLEARYEQMRADDRRASQHPSDLYALWNSKPYFLDQAFRNMQLGGNTYEYAFWNDAESFRHENLVFSGEWPDRRRVEEVWREGAELSGTRKEDLLFYPMWGVPHSSMKHWAEALGPIDSQFSQGTFFGGPPNAISWLNKAFYAYHDFYLFKMRAFIGGDQRILNSLFLLFPKRIITVWQHDPNAPEYADSPNSPLGDCGSAGSYHQFFFASEEDKHLMRDFWRSKIRFWSWSWWRKPKGCRTTRLLAMEGVLKRRFGDNWVPPKTAIDINAANRS